MSVNVDRRDFLRFAAILGLLARCETGLCVMEPDNANLTMDALARQLAQEQKTFFTQPFSFTWWLRGGEPGSPSHHLTLEGDRGSVKGIYIRAGFDPVRKPPTSSETFTGTVHLDRATTLLKQVFDGPVFRTAVKEEHEGEMRDGRKESWSFKNPRAQFSKMLFEPLPPVLDQARDLCQKIAMELVQIPQNKM